MVMQRLVWQGFETCTFEVVDEGPEPFVVKAKPIITNFYFGTTVGLFFRNSSGFGYWRSSNTCGPITAWRVAQLLPQIKTMRQAGDGYDSTVTGLVIAMQGDKNKDRLRKRAKDLGMSLKEYTAEIERLKQLWPSAEELRAMWDHLPHDAQDNLARVLKDAMVNNLIPVDKDLVVRIEHAELRIRTAEEQRARENLLIHTSMEPEVSLKQLMMDIGVKNLMFTLDEAEMGAPSHFDFEHLDREIKVELIGDRGFYSEIFLLTSEKQPNDASAHHTASMGGGSKMFWSDFGKKQVPRVSLEGTVFYFPKVRWDRITERFQLLVSDTDGERADGTWMSIEDLRSKMGTAIGWKAPFPVGASAHLLPPQFKATPTKKRRLFSR